VVLNGDTSTLLPDGLAFIPEPAQITGERVHGKPALFAELLSGAIGRFKLRGQRERLCAAQPFAAVRDYASTSTLQPRPRPDVVALTLTILHNAGRPGSTDRPNLR
jgi:hypothetical protein